jgi:ABC-type transporter Mla subunit MlaD
MTTTTTTVHRRSLDFTASLEQAYKDLESIYDGLDRQDGDVLHLVERIHKVETKVADLVSTLDGTVEDLRAVKKGKMKLLSSILEENAALAARLGTKKTGGPCKQ